MKLKPYLLILSPKAGANLTPQTLQGARMTLGENVRPIMALERASSYVIGFLSTDDAGTKVNKIKQACGDEVQILIVELGQDHAAWGPSWSHDFWALVDWVKSRPTPQ